MSKTAFERYAPFIQEYIYRKKWTDLREVQVEACEAILDTDDHVIIASGTASGKTEAAFFPMLTQLQQHPSNTIAIMYIGPLKALINDQFERLSDLLEESDIPVWPWHGDVSQSLKKQALKKAKGILQITPESLEALIMRRPGEAAHLFADLRFVVIDEIHALMGADRGLQVICLLSRMEKLTGCKPRRIGLSATLNDYQPAMTFLSAGTRRETIPVGIKSHQRTVLLAAESFVLPEEDAQKDDVLAAYNDFIYEHCHDKKCLIFTNSRAGAEEVINEMKALAVKKHERDVFFVHHGSVSAMLRHEAEAALKEQQGSAVTAATLTLELGIDVGDLDSIIQIGAPFSCSSFVQRLGRSGRRTGKSKMLFVNQFEEDRGSPFAMIPWDLIRTIAVIQLYLEERWVEPFEVKPKPFSLLAHQTLSTLFTYGELKPPDLAKNVLTMPPFAGIDQNEYRLLLQKMMADDYLQRMDSGEIIIGLKGEKIVQHYSFYAVFQDEEVYHVFSQNGEIGTLSTCPAVSEVFILAGRSWQVSSIDEDRKVIYVKMVKNNRIPKWMGDHSGLIHTRIVAQMKKVLQEEMLYSYLQPGSQDLLSKTRDFVKDNHLLNSEFIPGNANSFYLCPWVGTRQLFTINNLLLCGLKDDLQIYSIRPGKHHLEIRSDLSIANFKAVLKKAQIDINNPEAFISEQQQLRMDKYDYMVPKELLREALLRNVLDVKGAQEILKDICGPGAKHT